MRKKLLNSAIFGLFGLVFISSNVMARESYLPPKTKIVGGQKADSSSWKFFVAVSQQLPDGKFAPFCGASMISDKHAITAAHCVEQFDQAYAKKCGVTYLGPQVLALFPGATDIGAMGIKDKYNVKKIHVHPNAVCKKSLEEGVGQKYDNDLAIIELASPWKGPIAKIADDVSDDPDGPVKVAGYGKTESDLSATINARDGIKFQSHSRDLLDVVLETIPAEECQKGHEGTNANISNKQICAGVRTRAANGFIGDSCNGDSGGPLVAYDGAMRPYQVGVVSWGPSKCGKVGSPGVYSRLSYFNPWIKTIVPKYAGAAPVEKNESLSEEAAGVTAIDTLLNAADGRIKVEVCIDKIDLECGGNAFDEGEYAYARVISDMPGQVILIDQDAKNRLTQIFPNKKSPNITKGKGASDPLKFGPYIVSEPYGKSKLIAILVPPDVDLSAFINSSEMRTKGLETTFVGGWDSDNSADSYAFNLANQIAAALNQKESTLDLPGWGYAVLEYDVKK